MKTERCPESAEHARHEWYWAHILRRTCPGLVKAFCGQATTHVHHWYGDDNGHLCGGGGLAGRCRHGVQMLDECGACEVEQEMDALVTEIEGRER